ncbi:hypothetical protein [Aquimonas sp.]|jgi:hypothetical protein|uniref:hypothetical protein n=1 Tax=Aquimonas sp. TaxID=1872588 RepID=UPI0037C10652
MNNAIQTIIHSIETELATHLRVLRATIERHQNGDDLTRAEAAFRRRNRLRSLLGGVPLELKQASLSEISTLPRIDGTIESTREALTPLMHCSMLSAHDVKKMQQIVDLDAELQKYSAIAAVLEEVGPSPSPEDHLYTAWRDALRDADSSVKIRKKNAHLGIPAATVFGWGSAVALALLLLVQLVAFGAFGFSSYWLVAASVVVSVVYVLDWVLFLDADMRERPMGWPYRLIERGLDLGGVEEVSRAIAWFREGNLTYTDSLRLYACLDIRERMHQDRAGESEQLTGDFSTKG